MNKNVAELRYKHPNYEIARRMIIIIDRFIMVRTTHSRLMTEEKCHKFLMQNPNTEILCIESDLKMQHRRLTPTIRL